MRSAANAVPVTKGARRGASCRDQRQRLRQVSQTSRLCVLDVHALRQSQVKMEVVGRRLVPDHPTRHRPRMAEWRCHRPTLFGSTTAERGACRGGMRHVPAADAVVQVDVVLSAAAELRDPCTEPPLMLTSSLASRGIDLAGAKLDRPSRGVKTVTQHAFVGPSPFAKDLGNSVTTARYREIRATF